VIVLMVVLFAEVTLGVIFRMAGDPLVWYDEIASILLAWLTYYASVLAALKRAHIGVPGVVKSFPRGLRVATVIVSEGLVIGFFVLLGWLGIRIHDVLTTDFLVLVGIAAVLAVPAAYYAAERWLEAFAFRIDVAAVLARRTALIALDRARSN